MIIYTDPACLGYETPGHPERPFRVRASVELLERECPAFEWGEFEAATEEPLLAAHSPAHLKRLQEPRHFDADTAYHDGIYDLARLSAGAALVAMDSALKGAKAFSLMRPPGHHAEREQAMGFCYLNNVAIQALEARRRGAERVAVWDFDAHHGNGTEAILRGVNGCLYVSVHQHPCYPGTGTHSTGNVLNFPVAPFTDSSEHMSILEDSWSQLLNYEPELTLVSAGFDAYVNDPITQMSLRQEDFETLGEWLGRSPCPVAGVLEGGYSEDLPLLLTAFLQAWQGQ